jgi:hypothetical protein
MRFKLQRFPRFSFIVLFLRGGEVSTLIHGANTRRFAHDTTELLCWDVISLSVLLFSLLSDYPKVRRDELYSKIMELLFFQTTLSCAL